MCFLSEREWERDIDPEQSIVHEIRHRMNTVIVTSPDMAVGGLVLKRLVPGSAPITGAAAGFR